MTPTPETRVVPCEPTEEMIAEGYIVLSEGDGGEADVFDCYRAMLAAAPAAPAQEPELDAWPETLAEHLAERHKHLMLEREREAFQAAQKGDKSRQSIASTESERHRAVYHAMCLIVADEQKRGHATNQNRDAEGIVKRLRDQADLLAANETDWTDDALLRQAAEIIAAPPAPVAASVVEQHGWLYFNPDTGTELSTQHPIESGEVPDARDVVPATAERLAEELVLTWDNLEQAECRLSSHSPSSNPVAIHPAADPIVNALDPDMPAQEMRLHMGELSAQEMRAARAAIRWANSRRVRARLEPGEASTVRYRNWRGEVADRSIVPLRIWHGSTEWHPEPQLLLSAWDVEKQAERDFALSDFMPTDGVGTADGTGWQPLPPPLAAEGK